MIRFLSTAVLTVPLFLLTSPLHSANTCVQSSWNCTSTTTLSPAGPVIICPRDDDVVKVESSADCSGGGAGPAVGYRCSSLSNPFTYSGSGLTHVLAPTPGNDWSDALARCSDLRYSVVVQP